MPNVSGKRCTAAFSLRMCPALQRAEAASWPWLLARTCGRTQQRRHTCCTLSQPRHVHSSYSVTHRTQVALMLYQCALLVRGLFVD